MNADNHVMSRMLGWSIALSMLMMAAGVLAILMPPVSGIAITVLVACLMIFNGAVHVVYAWETSRAGRRLWGLLLGVLYMGVGSVIFLHPTEGLASLTFLLAVCLLAEALIEFILGFLLSPLPGSGWFLLDGLVTLLLALTIWGTWPASTLWALGMMVGVSMLFSGISRFTFSLAARRLAKALE